jgi:geranylgeranyl pyrophosphate synthase
VDQLCGGELDQVLSRDQFDITVADYLLVLKKKTSALFSLSVWGGVLLAGAASKKGQDAFRFGTSLGLLFQVSDDMLDFTGRADRLLKGGNQDFILGEITLPLIVLLKRLSPADRGKALDIMVTRNWDGLQWIGAQLADSGVLEECGILMRRYQVRCEAYLGTLVKTEYSAILAQVVAYISGRGG